MLRIFLSYCFDDQIFVSRVYRYLALQDGIDPFLCTHGGAGEGAFFDIIAQKINESTSSVLFCGQRAGATQKIEADLSLHYKTPKRLMVKIGDGAAENDFPAYCATLSGATIIVPDTSDDSAFTCARNICGALAIPWISDRLPSKYLFDYEKDVITAYIEGEGNFPLDMVRQGCPPKWPNVRRIPMSMAQKVPNPIPESESGFQRDTEIQEALIRVDARMTQHEGGRFLQEMVFPEAGPRKLIVRNPGTAQLRAAILVSGGLAPGVNAAIEGIVSRHRLYANWFASRGLPYSVDLIGYQEGFKALTRSWGRSIPIGQAGPRALSEEEVRRQAVLGGSMLATARADELLESPSGGATRADRLEDAARKLHADGINILYVIGGEGSMRAAYAVANVYRTLRNARPLVVIGVPKTMDNDILWVWQSFGFISAVERAREFLTHLHAEVTANPRLGIVQLFGSDSGFVVSHAALGSGVCDLALIPEMTFRMRDIFEHLSPRLRLRRDSGVPYGIVVMAETALPVDAMEYLDSEDVQLTKKEKDAIKHFEKMNRRVQGQTPDELRSGALKIVSGLLQAWIKDELSQNNEYWKDFRVFVNEPRHLIRSMPPTATEAIFAKRLGTLAVDSAMAGYTDVVVSQWLTEFVLVPFELAVLGKKRVRREGMFWKAVEMSTGQLAG